MNFDPDGAANRTELIFCRATVDPEVVTRTLELRATESYKVGDVVPFGQIERPSTVGMWKLRLPDCNPAEAVEQQLSQWVSLLSTKRDRLEHLCRLGYEPYLDCRAENRSLSLCIDPKTLAGLGELGIALSVWLYEMPAAETLGAAT